MRDFTLDFVLLFKAVLDIFSHMNKHFSAFLAFCSVALLVSGCAGSKESVPRPMGAQSRQAVLERQIQDRNRDLAVQHFINGAVLDSHGDFAKAVLEYQDALRYDQDPAIHYAISRDYSILGKHALAAKHARIAVQRDSVNVSYRENLAQIFLNAFQYEQAIEEYEAILKLDPYSTSAEYNLARLYQSSKPLRALEIYDRLLDREGEKWDILLHTTEILAGLGRWKEVAGLYERMLEIDPSNRALRVQLAEAYARAGEMERAVEILNSMVEKNESDWTVVATLADLYLDRGEYQKAIEMYSKLLKKEKDNPEVKLRIGIAYFGKIQSDSTFIPRAREMFVDVMGLTPGDWRPHWYLGAIASLQRQDSLAAAYFARVTELEPRNVEAWWFTGTHYFDKGMNEEVLRIMDHARRAIPSEARFFFLTGLTYSRMQNSEEAANFLEQALRLKPDDLNTLSTLALIYDGLKRYQESDSLYERALELDPDFHLVLNNYGYSLSERGLQLDRALEMAHQAVEAEPENPSYLDTLGWVYFKLGNYAEAKRFIEKAMATDNASATIVEHMGDVFFKLGQKEEARQFWQQALEMDAKNETLKEKIARGSL